MRPRLTVPVLATTSVSDVASGAGPVVSSGSGLVVSALATVNVCSATAPAWPLVSVWRTRKVCWPAARPV